MLTPPPLTPYSEGIHYRGCSHFVVNFFRTSLHRPSVVVGSLGTRKTEYISYDAVSAAVAIKDCNKADCTKSSRHPPNCYNPNCTKGWGESERVLQPSPAVPRRFGRLPKGQSDSRAAHESTLTDQGIVLPLSLPTHRTRH